MAEDAKKGQDSKSGGSSPIGTIIVLLCIILGTGICALLVFNFFLKDKLAGSEDTETATEAPLTGLVPVTIEDGMAAIKMRDPEMVPGTLLYTVTFECANQATADVISANKSRFVDMLRRLHSNLSEADCADPAIPDSIQRQALDQANDHLRKLEPDPEKGIRVTNVYHDQFYPAM
jgi:flagellar basal body-associated protein FliL